METEDESSNETLPSTHLSLTVGQAIWLLIKIVLLTVALALAAGLLLSPKLIEHAAGQGIIQGLAIAIVLVWALERKGTSFREILPLSPVSTRLLLVLVPTFFGIQILTSEIDNLIRILFPFLQGLGPPPIVGDSPWGTFLLGVIIAPVTEEPLFRGFILTGLLANYPERKAILYSAVLFGAMHMSPAAMISLSLWGWVVGWVFVRTGSLIPCLFVHALTNLFVWTAAHVITSDLPGVTPKPGEEAEFQPLWLDLVGVTLTVIGFWMLTNLLARPTGRAGSNYPM